jgi:integrase
MATERKRKKAKSWPGGYKHPVSGIYFIRRDVAGVRFHKSTRCSTLEGALAELKRFERDPAGYVPGGGTRPDGHDFAAAVTEYLKYSAGVRGNSAAHVTAQAAYFGTWVMFLEQRGLTTLEEVGTTETVDAFISWRRSGGVKRLLAKALHSMPEGAEKDKVQFRYIMTRDAVGPHSIALDVAAVKALFTWAKRTELLPENLLREYAMPKRPKHSSKIQIITDADWQKVREHLKPTWQLVGDVLLGSMMRYSSLARLSPDEVDIEHNVIRLRGNKIKGKEGVSLPVSHRVAVAAKAVAMARIPPSVTPFDHALEWACLRAKVTRFSAHAFRHTSASWALEDGVGLKELQGRLAHSSASTSEIYLHRLAGAREAYRGRL